MALCNESLNWLPVQDSDLFAMLDMAIYLGLVIAPYKVLLYKENL